MKPIISAGLLCLSCVVLYGQDAPAPPPAQQQTPAPTVAPPEIAKDDPDNGGSIAGFYWLSSGRVSLIGGKKSANAAAQSASLAGSDKKTKGATVAIPAGKFNRVEVSFFQAYGIDDVGPAPRDLAPFGVNIPQGEELVTSFQLRNFKIVWNYLTFPSPPLDSKFRVKTFWGAQYTRIEGVVDAPLDLGNTQLPAVGSRQIIYPVLGIGVEYIAGKHFYMDLRGDGFALPHRAVYWNGEANLVIRTRHIELFGGYHAFHFKTNPQNDEYISGTLRGPAAGLRWMFH